MPDGARLGPTERARRRAGQPARIPSHTRDPDV